MRPQSIRRAGVLAASAALMLAGCATPTATPTPAPSATETPTVSVSATPTPSPSEVTPTPSPSAAPLPELSVGPPPQVGNVDVVLTGLQVPWGLALLPDGSVLITERNTANVLWYPGTGTDAVEVGGDGAEWIHANTAPAGEGGLLGITFDPATVTAATADVFIYHTTAAGNEVARLLLTGLDTAAPTLTDARTILAGIPKANIHNGGRLAFGPDGFLYVTTGDAGNTALSQDATSLAGKILRITTDGAPAPGNPWENQPQWSIGHRNVQGIGWTADGVMYASELGQNTWDELNIITPGANYGWPVVEGVGDDPAFVNPIVTWPPAEASPSGIAVTDTAVYVAALRGERMWQVPLGGDDLRQLLVGEYGRLRAVVAAGPDTLWVVTTNISGGEAAADDDLLLRVEMRPIIP